MHLLNDVALLLLLLLLLGAQATQSAGILLIEIVQGKTLVEGFLD